MLPPNITPDTLYTWLVRQQVTYGSLRSATEVLLTELFLAASTKVGGSAFLITDRRDGFQKVYTASDAAKHIMGHLSSPQSSGRWDYTASDLATWVSDSVSLAVGICLTDGQLQFRSLRMVLTPDKPLFLEGKLPREMKLRVLDEVLGARTAGGLELAVGACLPHVHARCPWCGKIISVPHISTPQGLLELYRIRAQDKCDTCPSGLEDRKPTRLNTTMLRRLSGSTKRFLA